MDFNYLKQHPLTELPGLVAKFPRYLWRRKLLLGALILVLLILLAYAIGYRVGPGLTLTRVGTLVLTNLPEGAAVYVNEALHKNARASELRVQLLPGTHSILIGTDAFYPWNELVTVPEGTDVTIRPIFIEKSATETNLKDIDRENAEVILDEMPLPTRASPLTAWNGCVLLFVEEGSIIAEPNQKEGCTPPPFLCDENSCGATLVLAPTEQLRAVIPFPERDDAIIIALGKAVYALEIDPRSPQFFAPILRESRPEIAPWPGGSIVVREGGAVFTVSFQ